MKFFECGLVVGRFQVFHNGHEQIVRTALSLSKRVVLLIGSSQECGTEKNPLSYEQRKEVIGTIFRRFVDSGRLLIAPLPDLGVGNVPAWGNYVLSSAFEVSGVMPDLLVSGREERRINWFDSECPPVNELYVPKSIDVSASLMREFLLQDNYARWCEFTNPSIRKLYPELRRSVLLAQGNASTMSV